MACLSDQDLRLFRPPRIEGNALHLLSALRLGIDLGIFTGVDWSSADRLLLVAQPAYLQLRCEAAQAWGL